MDEEGRREKKEGSESVGVEDEDEIRHALCHHLLAEYD